MMISNKHCRRLTLQSLMTILIVCCCCLKISYAFIIIRNYRHSRIDSIVTTIALRNTPNSFSFPAIPSIEQLSSDPFIKQVSYADFIVTILLPEDNNRQTDVVMKRIRAQLSHSDGIRGFMVSYLTQSIEITSIPAALMTGIIEIITSSNNNNNEQTKRNELITLVCKNVIMPTAMITVHTDKELSQQSYQTAQNGILLLKSIYNELSDDYTYLIKDQLTAIVQVAKKMNNNSNENEQSSSSSLSSSNDEIVTYWTEFFHKWDYKDQQRIDIAAAVENILR